MPGIGLRHLASWAKAEGPGAASSPGDGGGGESQGGGNGSWLAWPCAECGECLPPAPACPPAEANAWRGAGAGRLPSHPLTPAALSEGQALAWAGKRGQDYAFTMLLGTVCPIWASKREGPKVPPPKGLGRPVGEEQKGLMAGNLRATWIPHMGVVREAWLRTARTGTGQVLTTRQPPARDLPVQ